MYLSYGVNKLITFLYTESNSGRILDIVLPVIAAAIFLVLAALILTGITYPCIKRLVNVGPGVL